MSKYKVFVLLVTGGILLMQGISCLPNIGFFTLS
jgi:hypothetical protein